MARLQEIISEAKANSNFIYRGCAFEKYDLVPTLARKLKADVSFDQYNIYSDVVKKAAERGYSEVGMNGLADGLSQHYGLSTSYLDWSYSVYVALYFAFTSYIKQFVNDNILDQHIDRKMYCLRDEFNKHKYCIYRLNKTLYDELKNQYPELPLKLSDTDDKNERMKAQQGLLSSIDSAKVNNEAKIRSSQIKILADWLQSNNPDDFLKQSGNKYSWNNETLLEKITFELPQRDRNYLQKCLKENGAISTILFPDFEGVKKNIEFSEDYNILRDWEIAYQESPFHSKATALEDLLQMANGNQKVINSSLNTDRLGEGEFFPFQ
ncbi:MULTISPECIES: FRG domain-containing protein [Lactiplantibacillus]|uniref:FRG domain-containing protein n=1 Tax=Lactiplantibacillus modestisalitolerans TaxID=1457219 RepID=A0ABV5WYL3_9LACO|nr:FRG domain-containing protein [Lactiplantibacillus plantarum]QAR39383.1 FRG domain-containing protein [Lactiplantibacillus plantarum]QAR39431.1 FRG domain-containing protein [Lactiplantibacillus plantarum]RWZ05137.1 FRG domain-containing protein [Lactiplantibacillus plantarum]